MHWIMVQENQHKLISFIYNILKRFSFWFDKSYPSRARNFCCIYCRLLLLLVFKHLKKTTKINKKKWSKQISMLSVLLFTHIYTFCELILVIVQIKILAESTLWWHTSYFFPWKKILMLLIETLTIKKKYPRLQYTINYNFCKC